MNLIQKFSNIIFHPIPPVLFYLFMAVTTLHMQSPFLLSIHIEGLVLIWALLNCIIFAILNDTKWTDVSSTAFILGLVFIASPIITSLLRQDYLAVLWDEEFKTLFKMILFAPCLLLLMRKESYREMLINGLVLFYIFFSCYFLYRYLILHEIREFDQRPLLKIRHGDPNFLCTFFSMMIPIALLQAYEYFLGGKKLRCFVFVIASVLFLSCSFLTESRMGILAALIGIVYLLSRPLPFISRKKIVTLSITLGIIALIGMGQKTFKRFGEMQDKSNQDRYLTWKNGVIVFLENPIIGIGIHQAKNTFYQNTGYPHFQSTFSQLEVHNTYLKVAAELGIVGLICFSMLFLWPWISSLKSISLYKYFALSSMIILSLSIMAIGIVYKDLFILHLFFIAGISHYSAPVNRSPH